MQEINRSKLFWASCLALLVTSLSFGIRAGILNDLTHRFELTATQLSSIVATAFWGFPLAVIIGGMIVDIIGMKRLLVLAFIFHAIGIVLTIFANGYWSLFISTLTIGIANGTVEAACNPLVTTLYPDNKTSRLNHFHLWFPGGIVIGSLVSLFFTQWGLSWQIQVSVMMIPTLIYGYLFSKLSFPVTERVSAGHTTADMYKALISPLFIFMFICMLGTAITELFTGQWIGLLLKNVTDNAILLLTLTTGMQVIGRAFAEPVVHKFSPSGVLVISAVFSAAGLYMLATMTGTSVFFGAVIFGIGVCYFWPTMLGFVSENIPKSGALGINVLGGAGMLAVTFYTLFMGPFYDNLVIAKLPGGADLATYQGAAPGTNMANLLLQANSAAGPEVLKATLVIPVALIVAFGGLYFYMKSRTKTA